MLFAIDSVSTKTWKVTKIGKISLKDSNFNAVNSRLKTDEALQTLEDEKRNLVGVRGEWYPLLRFKLYPLGKDVYPASDPQLQWVGKTPHP